MYRIYTELTTNLRARVEAAVRCGVLTKACAKNRMSLLAVLAAPLAKEQAEKILAEAGALAEALLAEEVTPFTILKGAGL